VGVRDPPDLTPGYAASPTSPRTTPRSRIPSSHASLRACAPSGSTFGRSRCGGRRSTTCCPRPTLPRPPGPACCCRRPSHGYSAPISIGQASARAGTRRCPGPLARGVLGDRERGALAPLLARGPPPHPRPPGRHRPDRSPAHRLARQLVHPLRSTARQLISPAAGRRAAGPSLPDRGSRGCGRDGRTP
jgi:hypothetical protein